MTKGMRNKQMKGQSFWQPMVVSRILKHSAYYGEYHQFITASLGRLPGYKAIARRYTNEAEQTILSIPAIVTKQLAEKAQRRVSANKQLAKRNNRQPVESLLLGGFAKCGYCGTSLRLYTKTQTLKTTGQEVTYSSYNCAKPYNQIGTCRGCSIPLWVLDGAVWEKAVEIIRDPSEVDRKIAQLTAEDAVTQRRRRTLKTLTDIRKDQLTLRTNLNTLMRKKILDESTVAFLSGQLKLLEKQEQEALSQLADAQAMQQKYDKLQVRLAEFHQQCTAWRDQLDDPEFTPLLSFKQDALQFFGISVTVWKQGTEPRYVLQVDPPDIVELLS
jgi:Recombinase zinc beta ribbon domain/Recombinase